MLLALQADSDWNGLALRPTFALLDPDGPDPGEGPDDTFHLSQTLDGRLKGILDLGGDAAIRAKAILEKVANGELPVIDGLPGGLGGIGGGFAAGAEVRLVPYGEAGL